MIADDFNKTDSKFAEAVELERKMHCDALEACGFELPGAKTYVDERPLDRLLNPHAMWELDEDQRRAFSNAQLVLRIVLDLWVRQAHVPVALLSPQETGESYIRRSIPKEWTAYTIGNFYDDVRTAIAGAMMERIAMGHKPLRNYGIPNFADITRYVGPAWDGTYGIRLFDRSEIDLFRRSQVVYSIEQYLEDARVPFPW